MTREDLEWRATLQNRNIQNQRLNNKQEMGMNWPCFKNGHHQDMYKINTLTWHPEGRLKVNRPKATWRRTTGQKRTKLSWNSWASARTVANARTDKDGGSISRLYVPEGTKRIGEIDEVSKWTALSIPKRGILAT